MLDYIQKFHKLPKDLRDRISTPEVMSAIDELEKKYNINLAAVVMNVMIKSFNIKNLSEYFISKFNLAEEQARQLENNLKEKVFINVSDYLGIGSDKISNQILQQKRESKDLREKYLLTPTSQNFFQKKQTTESQARGAGFFFSPEDEEEIRKLTKQINNNQNKLQIINNIENNIEQKINQIISDSQINFSSELLKDRFKQIITMYFRNIRNLVDTKQALMRSHENGGVDLNIELTDRVINSIKKAELLNQNVDKHGVQNNISTPHKYIPRDIEYDFRIKKNNENNFQIPPLSPILIEQKPQVKNSTKNFSSLQNIKSESSSKQLNQQNLTNKIKEIKPSAEKKLDNSKNLDNSNLDNSKILQLHDINTNIISSLSRMQQNGKKRIEDIKFPPKIMDPISELRFLDLTNFRRLDQDPYQSIKKIKEKIDLLAKEQYSRKLEGLKAWRSGLIYKLYLNIGKQSIEENKPISLVITERQQAGKNYLTEEEFAAVTDLNKALRF